MIEKTSKTRILDRTDIELLVSKHFKEAFDLEVWGSDITFNGNDETIEVTLDHKLKAV